MSSEGRAKGVLARGARLEIVVDGEPLAAYEGETVAAAILASGRRALRTSARRGEPRGLYCGMGVCFECVMTIDGHPNVRTCQTRVRPGMQVRTQAGNGDWSALMGGGNGI